MKTEHMKPELLAIVEDRTPEQLIADGDAAATITSLRAENRELRNNVYLSLGERQAQEFNRIESEVVSLRIEVGRLQADNGDMCKRHEAQIEQLQRLITTLRADNERLRAALLPTLDWLEYAYHNVDSVTATAVKAHLPTIRAALEGK